MITHVFKDVWEWKSAGLKRDLWWASSIDKKDSKNYYLASGVSRSEALLNLKSKISNGDKPGYNPYKNYRQYVKEMYHHVKFHGLKVERVHESR